MKNTDYKLLKVWQASMDFVKEIYRLTDAFPTSERFGLIDQLRRACVSIPSNIAEGSSRDTNKEFIRFLYISRGSASEVETQLMLAEMLEYATPEESKRLLEKVDHIKRMLSSLISFLSKSDS